MELFRSGGSAVIRRFMQEQQAGHLAADVLTTSDPAATAAMARKGIFVAFKPTNFDKVPAEAKDPNGAHVAQRLNLITIFVRHDKIADAAAPKTWSDLLDPKYKGQMVTTDPSYTALGLMTVATLAKKFGWGFYEKLRAADTMVVQGNQQVADMLKNGERLIAAGALDSYAADERKAGHPVATVYPARRRADHRLADLDREGLAQSERRQAAGRVHAERHRAEILPRGRRLCGARRHRGRRPAAPSSPTSRRCRSTTMRSRRKPRR